MLSTPVPWPAEIVWPADLMTVNQVAATVHLTPKTVRVHIRAGRLAAVRFGDGGRYRVRREDAQRWVTDHVYVPRDVGVDERVEQRRRERLAGAPKAATPTSWPRRPLRA